MSRRISRICMIVVLSLLLAACGRQGPSLDDVTAGKDNTFTCSFEGVSHDFILELPDEPKGAPLIVMLHGYGESAEVFKMHTHLEEYANKLGYAVVYVTGAPNPYATASSNCWNNGIDADGNNDVDFLRALVSYLQKEYSFDKKNTFAAGFSNGAFMTHRLAMEATDTFSACVGVAGMMPESIWEEKESSGKAGFFQITGEKDDLIPKNSDGSAKHAKAPAIEDVCDHYVKVNGLDKTEESEIGKGSTLTKYSSAGSKKQVWHLFVKGGRHSWPEESITGIDTNELIMEFLETQKS